MLFDMQRDQVKILNLSASENFAHKYILQSMGSCLINKYSEGYPGARYYGGNQFIDEIENLCIKRALEAFRLDPEKWHANVQPMSGSPANMAIYTALVPPGERIMCLTADEGGHITHGFHIDGKRVSEQSKFWDCEMYYTDPKTDLVDYDGLAKKALEFKPKLICAGFCAYPRDIDYERLR